MKPWVLVWAFIAVLFMELYSIFPVSDVEIKPFLISNQRISLQSWADYAAKIVAFCVLLWQLRNQTPEYWHQLNAFLWLMVGYLLDYFIIYNEPFGSLQVLGYTVWVSYTLFMLTLMGIILIRTCKI